MNDSANHFKLGLFVIAGVTAMLLVGGWLVTSGFREDTFTAYTFFDEPVTGLEVGSPIRYRGMTIGAIVDIRSAEDQRYIRVRSEIQVKKLIDLGLRDTMSLGARSPQIPTDLRARIERNIVTGIAFIQTDFYTDPEGRSPTYPFQVPENTVPAVPSATVTFEQALEESLTELPPLIGRLDEFIDLSTRKLADLDVAGVSRDARSAIGRIDRILAEAESQGLGSSLVKLIDEMRTAVRTIEDFLAELRADDGTLKVLVEAARRMVARVDESFAAADLGATGASIRDFGDSFALLARESRTLVPELRGAIEALRRVAELLERDPSALVRGRAMPEDPRRR